MLLGSIEFALGIKPLTQAVLFGPMALTYTQECLCVCHACASAFLDVSVYACMHACMHASIHACMDPCMHPSHTPMYHAPCTHTSMHLCLRASAHPCMLACGRASVRNRYVYSWIDFIATEIWLFSRILPMGKSEYLPSLTLYQKVSAIASLLCYSTNLSIQSQTSACIACLIASLPLPLQQGALSVRCKRQNVQHLQDL